MMAVTWLRGMSFGRTCRFLGGSPPRPCPAGAAPPCAVTTAGVTAAKRAKAIGRRRGMDWTSEMVRSVCWQPCRLLERPQPVQRPEAGGQRPEARGRRPEAEENCALLWLLASGLKPQPYLFDPQFTTGSTFRPGGLSRTMFSSPSCTPLNDQA